MTDIIDTLAGLAPDSPLAQISDRKPITRDQAQTSYRALFEPADTTDVSLQERFAIATTAPRYRLARRPSTGYGPESPMHNPAGLWRLEPV